MRWDNVYLVLVLLCAIAHAVEYQLVVQVTEVDSIPLLNKAVGRTRNEISDFTIERVIDEDTFNHFASSSDPSANGPSKSLEELSRFVNIGLHTNDRNRAVKPTADYETLQRHLLQLPFVAAAYLKPIGSEPVIEIKRSDANQVLDSNRLVTPLLEEHELHLDGPGGFNVSAIRNLKGGKGEGVSIIDVERGWTFNHEDLIESNGTVVVGEVIPGAVDHGTSVIGVIAGNENGFGVTGIAPKVKVFGASWVAEGSIPNMPKTILEAAKKVSPGDIMLIEVHHAGPRARGGQMGYIAMEFWPDNFHALSVATEMGVIVVEAAGNGAEDLDDPIYNKPLVSCVIMLY
jgi:hypothetical protein